MRRCSFFVHLLLIFFALFNLIFGQAQSDSLLILWAELIEDEGNLAERLEELAENPVNINTNNRNELLRIPLIRTRAVDSILHKKSKIGRFTSKRQIRPILGAELYDLIKEFITIKSKSKHSITYTHKSYYGIESIQQINNSTYRGDGLYNYNKFQFNWFKKYRIGMVTQKDIGEANYLDYVNGYIEYSSNRIKGILGSYYCHFGEGLIFSNAYGQQKSSIASLPFRPSKEGGFATLNSSENTGLFGIFFNIKQIYGSDLYIFYSNTNRDAQFSQDWNQVIGIDYDGYHRSDSEIKKKDVIDESTIGIACSYSILKSFNLGLNYANIKYNPLIQFDDSIVGKNAYRRQRFKFSGSQLDQYSMSYDIALNRIQLHGELAGSQPGGSAFTQSLFVDDDFFSFGIKYWWLSKNFQSPCGRVFDNSNPFPQAEEGFYLGLSLNPFENFSINSFKIIKKDLWRTYLDQMPKMKDELLIELNYQPKNISALVRLRIKDNEYFTDFEDKNSITRNIEQQNIYRLQLDYKPTKNFIFRTRWESTDIQAIDEQGSYLFEDIHFLPNSSISIHTRFLFYRTDSYNSRLYEYESDLPGSYANYAVFGEGRIFNLLIKWKIYKQISIWLKYRYNNNIKRDLSPSIIRKDNNELQRSLRFQIQLRL